MRLCAYMILVCDVCVYYIMHNACMQAHCNHVYLVHTPHQSRMHLVYTCYLVHCTRTSRRDHMYKTRRMWTRSRFRTWVSSRVVVTLLLYAHLVEKSSQDSSRFHKHYLYKKIVDCKVLCGGGWQNASSVIACVLNSQDLEGFLEGYYGVTVRLPESIYRVLFSIIIAIENH